LKLGTRLALYLSLIIILVLSGYGYFHITSRREVLIQSMRLEVRSLAEALKFSLEKISLPRELIYIQELLDSISEPERTLGVIFYHKGKDHLFHSQALTGNNQVFLEFIRQAMEKGQAQENFGTYGGAPVYSYSFGLKDSQGRIIGGVAIVQDISAIQKHIQRATRTIVLYILALIAGTVALVFWVTRKWLNQPMSKMTAGIERLAQGDLEARIDLHGRDELSELAQSFNQMAASLKDAREGLIREGESKLELERTLRETEKLATIGQLASGLAHEIGTPLNIISGRVQLMKRKLEESSGLQKNLDVIFQQTKRITRIIHQLLGFVRKKRPEQVPLDVRPLLESMLEFVGPQIEKQRVRVAKDFSPFVPQVRGDSDLLQQVFLNLILNALHAMPQGGTLRLSAAPQRKVREGLEVQERNCLEVRVEDSGAGMEEEVKKNIFRPFFTTKERETGTGLGLTVTLGIIRDHEGWIEVESEVGKGSLFKLYFPALDSVPKTGPLESPPADRGED
jgi:signal transduction histidine kinase